MADELRPRPIPQTSQPAGALPANQLPGPGRPPLRTGKVHFSDFTRRQLMAVGWKEGDPIPGDLGQRLQQIQAEVCAERDSATLEGSDLAAGWQPVKGEFVNIEQLPQERQDEIRQYLQEYKQQLADEAAQAQVDAEIEESIPQSVQGPARDVMKQQIVAGNAAQAARESGRAAASVVDDRRPSPPLPVPEGKTLGGVIGNMGPAEKIEELKRRQRAAQEAPQPAPEQPAPEAPSTGVTSTHTHCNRCLWPDDVPFEIKPTDEDKQRFLAAVLGLGRFEKSYPLLGGNLEVFFRSLTTDESAMVQRQVGSMVRAGAIRGDGEFWANLHELRLAIACSKIVVGGNVVYEVPSVAEWAKANPRTDGVEEYTPLPRLRDNLYEKGATQEPLRVILGQQHRQFQQLVELLEVMTNDPDFWKGIGLPA